MKKVNFFIHFDIGNFFSNLILIPLQFFDRKKGAFFSNRGFNVSKRIKIYKLFFFTIWKISSTI